MGQRGLTDSTGRQAREATKLSHPQRQVGQFLAGDD